MKKEIKRTGLAVLGVALLGVLAAWLIKDQIIKHKRDLFSPRFLRRLAALGHMAKVEASVDNINLMRDFILWERKESLRDRARLIIKRMEEEASMLDSPAF
ncbi:uncharacterized protein METZ01_LOCUS212779 [marine metagenome]|uniref:Uncharacterized protein n=1 Tax=marine metagenome TaxID=408172 RepID=A0A382FB71_9ZZZZ